jgi:hypothetical protein
MFLTHENGIDAENSRVEGGALATMLCDVCRPWHVDSVSIQSKPARERREDEGAEHDGLLFAY